MELEECRGRRGLAKTMIAETWSKGIIVYDVLQSQIPGDYSMTYRQLYHIQRFHVLSSKLGLPFLERVQTSLL